MPRAPTLTLSGTTTRTDEEQGTISAIAIGGAQHRVPTTDDRPYFVGQDGREEHDADVTLTKMLACSRWLMGSTKYPVTMNADSTPARKRANAKWRRGFPRCRRETSPKR